MAHRVCSERTAETSQMRPLDREACGIVQTEGTTRRQPPAKVAFRWTESRIGPRFRVAGGQRNTIFCHASAGCRNTPPVPPNTPEVPQEEWPPHTYTALSVPATAAQTARPARPVSVARRMSAASPRPVHTSVRNPYSAGHAGRERSSSPGVRAGASSVRTTRFPCRTWGRRRHPKSFWRWPKA